MKKVFFILTLSALLQACTLDQEGVALDSIGESECEKSGSLFCNEEASVTDLELVIESDDTVIPASANGDCNGSDTRDLNGDKPLSEENQYCFDFSGACNEAGLDTALIVGTLSLDGFNTSYTLGSCKRGRFHVQLRLTLNPSQICQRHEVRLELIGEKADGTKVQEPSKAKKTTHFQVLRHEDCPI